MSNRITPSACGSISGVQPVAASVASVSRSMISSSSPTSSAMRARNSAPFSAARQASVAIRRARVTPRLRILSRQMAERLDRARDRRLADAAGRRHPLAEPDDAGERIDDAEAVAGRARDQQPAIVGAEIERGIGRAAVIAAALRAVVTRIAIGRPPPPPGLAAVGARSRAGRGRRCPGPRPFIEFLPAAPKPPSGSTARPCPNPRSSKCNTQTARATDARRTHGAARMSLSKGPASFISRQESRLPPADDAGRHESSVQPPPAAEPGLQAIY